MPRKYIRKVGAKPRGLWTEENLLAASEEIREGKSSVNKISRQYGIPSRTLRRRFVSQNTKKLTLGSYLSFENLNIRLIFIITDFFGLFLFLRLIY